MDNCRCFSNTKHCSKVVVFVVGLLHLAATSLPSNLVSLLVACTSPYLFPSPEHLFVWASLRSVLILSPNCTLSFFLSIYRTRHQTGQRGPSLFFRSQSTLSAPQDMPLPDARMAEIPSADQQHATMQSADTERAAGCNQRLLHIRQRKITLRKLNSKH